jgi:hypothetical protein
MPVLRVNNNVDAYRLRAQCKDIHELAARPNKKPLTEFVNRQILEILRPTSNDVLVDIGCGDASLLRMAKEHVSKCIGITSSAEEQKKLESVFPRVSFIASQAQSLPLSSGSASKIICNATLFYLPSESDVQAALREMARIAHPDATIWVGEIPEINEYAHYGMYRGTSMLGLLWYLLRHHGFRAFLGMIHRWLKAQIGSEQIVLNSAGIYHAHPHKLISLAESCGLRLQSYFRHKELDRNGKVINSEFRYDYIFTV